MIPNAGTKGKRGKSRQRAIVGKVNLNPPKGIGSHGASPFTLARGARQLISVAYMIRKFICFDELPPVGSDCDALLRIQDYAPGNEISRAPGKYMSEFTVCANDIGDIKNCLNWLRGIDKEKWIRHVAVVVTSSKIGLDDFVAVMRIFLPNVALEIANGCKLQANVAREESLSPFEDGAMAALDGVDLSSNPFPLGTQNWEMWSDGHQSTC